MKVSVNGILTWLDHGGECNKQQYFNRGDCEIQQHVQGHPSVVQVSVNHWPVNYFDWPIYHLLNCPLQTRSDHQASLCIWDTEFVVDIVRSVELDPDLGGKRKTDFVGVEPTGPGSAHSAAADGCHCQPNTNTAEELCLGAASSTDY